MLSDEKIKLRAIEPTDLDTLFRWENDTSLWALGCTISPYSRKQLWDYIENYDGDIFSARQLRFMIEEVDSRAAVGTIDLYDFDPVNRRAYIGILIDANYGRRGYGTRALALVADYARTMIGMHQLAAVVPERNIYSHRLFEKCGYEATAILRSWLRTGITYQNATLFQLLL